MTTRATNDADSPQWLAGQRNEAWLKLQNSPSPTKLDENWRFGDISKADVSRFVLPRVTSEDELATLARLLPAYHADVIRIVFINGVLSELPVSLPVGLQIAPLSALGAPVGQAVCSTEWGKFGSERLALLNMASMGNGIAVMTSQGAVIEPVVEIIYAVMGDQSAIFPHTIIRLAADSKLQVIERHVSLDLDEQLCVGVQNIAVDASAELCYALVQQMNDQGQAWELGRVCLQQEGRIEHVSTHRGASWCRQELMTSLCGRDAHAEILSANHVTGNRVLDQRTYQDHVSPGAYSNLSYRNVLSDRAKTVFAGMIKVNEGAHETDAYQSNRNLMLSNDAESNSLPGLEILADGVRCSHGSATSSLEPEEVFYLRSRGIDRQHAEEMIAHGVLLQVLGSIENESFRHRMAELI